METVILIKVESLSDLEPTQNFLVLNTTTGELFRGDGENQPIKMLDENNSTFANHFLLMGA